MLNIFLMSPWSAMILFWGLFYFIYRERTFSACLEDEQKTVLVSANDLPKISQKYSWTETALT